jgi:hypothetical protein
MLITDLIQKRNILATDLSPLAAGLKNGWIISQLPGASHSKLSAIKRH